MIIILGSIIALTIFYYFNYQLSIRRKNRKENLKERREQFMEDLLQSIKDKDSGGAEK